jgi:tripartite-type tricarboxylate transporter receptor subunit TctC
MKYAPVLVVPALLSCMAGPAAAQSAPAWPTKPVRIISPFAPGGGADITARAIGQKLGPALGQQVVIDNRGGAGGMIGVELAAKSPPDGYTLVLGTIGPIAINPSLYAKMPYDPVKDLAPITLAANALNILVIHPSLPVKNVKDMVALAKARPNDLNFGSSGPGAADHLAGELFNYMTGAKMTHVPYKGGAPAMIDLVAGNVQLIFSTVSTAVGSIQASKVRPIAMAGNQRFELMPEIPTMSEGGLKGFEANNWYGMFAPAGTPKEITARVRDETIKALAAPDVKKRLLETGIVATTNTPEQFAVYIDSETKKWAKVIKAANIKVE